MKSNNWLFSKSIVLVLLVAIQLTLNPLISAKSLSKRSAIENHESITDDIKDESSSRSLRDGLETEEEGAGRIEENDDDSSFPTTISPDEKLDGSRYDVSSLDLGSGRDTKNEDGDSRSDDMIVDGVTSTKSISDVHHKSGHDMEKKEQQLESSSYDPRSTEHSEESKHLRTGDGEERSDLSSSISNTWREQKLHPKMKPVEDDDDDDDDRDDNDDDDDDDERIIYGHGKNRHSPLEPHSYEEKGEGRSSDLRHVHSQSETQRSNVNSSTTTPIISTIITTMKPLANTEPLNQKLPLTTEIPSTDKKEGVISDLGDVDPEKILVVVVTKDGKLVAKKPNAKVFAKIFESHVEDAKIHALSVKGDNINVSPNNTFIFPAGTYYFPTALRFAGFW